MAGKKFDISAVLKGVDKATAPFRKVASVVSRSLVGAFAKAASAARRATGGFGRFALGLNQTLELAGKLRRGLGALHEFAMKGDELGKFSRQVGVSVEALQELRFAAGQQGVGAQQFDKALKGMSKRVGELRAGTGSLYTFLEKAGLKTFAGQLKGAKSNEEAFDLLMAALQRVEDPAKRAALAAAAFGGRGVEMTRIAEAGADGLEKLRKQARDLGLVTTEQASDAEAYANAMGEFKQVFGGVAAKIGGALLPKLTKAAQFTSQWIQANSGLIRQRLARVFEVIGRVMDRIPWGAIVAGVKSAIDAVRPFATTVVNTIRDNWGSISRYLGKAWESIKIVTRTAVNVVHELWKGLSANLGRIIDGIKGFFGGWVDFLKGVFTLDMDLAYKGIKGIWGGLTDFFSGLWDSVKGAFRAAWAGIKEWLDKFTPQPIKDAWNGLAQWFKDLWASIWGGIGWIVEKVEAAAKAGKDLLRAATLDDKTRNRQATFASDEETGQGRAALHADERTRRERGPSLAELTAAFRGGNARMAVPGGGELDVNLNITGLPAGADISTARVLSRSGAAKLGKVSTANTGRRQVGAP